MRTALKQCLAVVAVACGVLYGFTEKPSNNFSMMHQPFNKDILNALRKATGWINTKELKPEDLRGKVVLVNFCTYTCINWLRTLPYVQAWSAKYKDHGLVVIGVHTPEFEFEKKPDNVLQAIKERKIGYAIATDNAMAIWNSFNNNYWPALYFIDVKGYIRHQQFGEGNYAESEKLIQQLLEEAGATNIDHQLVTPNPVGAELAADWVNLLSEENYLGEDRTTNFIRAAGSLELNQWTYTGGWTSTRNNIILNKANGKIIYCFHARDLHLVMGSANRSGAIRFRVLIDGKPPGSAHGSDIDEQGYGIVTAQKLYQLIRQKGTIANHEFEIEFFDASVEAFSFTFG